MFTELFGHLIRPHHLVVLMINDMTVPDVTRTRRRIERIEVFAGVGFVANLRYVAGRPAHQQSQHLAGVGPCNVLPA